MFEEFFPFIWAAIGITGGILALRQLGSIVTAKYKAVGRVAASQNQKGQIDIANMLSNLEIALQNQSKLLQDMKAKGATPEQLAPLEGQIQQMQWVKSNEWWIAPLIDWLGPMANKMLKGFF